jgi:Flp pilus assembly protein TadB
MASEAKRLGGPPITVTCGCGEVRYLHYGERWPCEKCGTAWDTRQIPEDEYTAVRRIQRRHIAVPALVFVVVLATVVLFMIYGRAYAIILLPFALMCWFIFVRPLQRRRLRAQLAELPEWELTPE